MDKLSTEAEKIKKKYREIFLETNDKFNSRVEKMGEEELKKFLKEDAIKEIYERQMKIIESKKEFSCVQCGACCKLAASEFSPEELKQKAGNNDKTAQEFITTFIPYKNEENAQKIYPEYFEMLKTKAAGEKIYFYHCPKVTEDNRCSDYENRPQICKNFPDNPIDFLPKNCAYCSWKEQTEVEALTLHAMLEIVMFYREKVK